MQVEEELRTYLSVLWRHKWMIVACALIASLVSLGISLLLTPTYSAVATVRVASAPGGAMDYVSLSSLTRLSNTYVEIATSDVSLDEVAKRLGLGKQPTVEVEVVPETELIDITASNPNPELAQAVANTLAEMLVEQSGELYGGSAPTARQILETQLQQAKADLDAVVAEYDSALRGVQPSASAPISDTLGAGSNAETLGRLLSVRQQIYTDLLQKYESARTNELLRANAITVTEPASLPRSPAKPKVPLNVALGLVAGLVMGVIYAFVAEGLNDSVRGVEDVTALVAPPVICQVPEEKRGVAALFDRILGRNKHGSQQAAYEQLSARLMLLGPFQQTPAFLVTSPEPGAGKSTISANLAVTLAEAGQRVVLLDMDFYRPRLQSLFALSNSQGLSDYLCGAIPLEAALRRTAYPNLRVATAGLNLERMKECLRPARLRELFDRLAGDADVVLVDAPAWLSVADPAVIASESEAVILVVARGQTQRRQLDLTLEQLAKLNARVSAVVLNRMPDSWMYGYYARERTQQDPDPAPAAAQRKQTAREAPSKQPEPLRSK